MRKHLNIGYDAKRLFLNATSLGNYARSTVLSLSENHPQQNLHLYTPDLGQRGDCEIFKKGPPFTIHTPPRGIPGTIWRTAGVIKALPKDGIDIYHGLSNELPIGISKTGIPGVVSIHDLNFRHYPEHYSRVDRAIYNGKSKYACEQANLVITLSESTKRDVQTAYKVPDHRIKVVYQPCHQRFYEVLSAETIKQVLQKYVLPKTYILYVGPITERKNLLALLKALDRLPAEFDIPLVVVGQVTPYFKKVSHYIAAKRLSHRVYFRHEVQDEDLPAIYQGAHLFCLPSLAEGFGLTVLEALASSVPVITSDRSSLPEAGGPSSIYVDPEDPDAIADGLEKVLHSETIRLPMVRLGKDYAHGFSGKACSDRLMEAYTGLLT